MKLITSFVIGILYLQSANCQNEEWMSLLDEDYEDHWEVFIGVPHGTVKNLDEMDTASDGINGEPLGLNNDPKKVFTFEKDGEGEVLHISGEIYGALSSKVEYKNYHLRLLFKWGEKKWEPRLDRKRDSGILYHCVGLHGVFWNVWMQSQEFQVQQGDMGDYYALAKTEMEIPSIKSEGGKGYDYKKGGTMNKFSSIDPMASIHCNKGFNNEKPHGEWNTLELICLDGTSLHIVNGRVVMALYNSKFLDTDEKVRSLTKGKIQLQSEGAEAYYKNIEIRSLEEIPNMFKRQLSKGF